MYVSSINLVSLCFLTWVTCLGRLSTLRSGISTFLYKDLKPSDFAVNVRLYLCVQLYI